MYRNSEMNSNYFHYTDSYETSSTSSKTISEEDLPTIEDKVSHDIRHDTIQQQQQQTSTRVPLPKTQQDVTHIPTPIPPHVYGYNAVSKVQMSSQPKPIQPTYTIKEQYVETEYDNTEYILAFVALLFTLMTCNPCIASCFVCKFNKSNDPRVRRYNNYIKVIMIFLWVCLALSILAMVAGLSFEFK